MSVDLEPPQQRSRARAIRGRLHRPRHPRRSLAAAATTIAAAAARADALAVNRLVRPSDRVTSAADGRALLASGEHPEAVAEQLQGVAIAVMPLVRMARRTRWLPRLPSALVASTVVSAAMTFRRGTRELQVVASLVDHRIETATGELADAALVKAATLALYLDPDLAPRPERGGLRLARLARRWAVRGAFGRGTGSAAGRALDAAERIDGAALAASWKDADAAGS